MPTEPPPTPLRVRVPASTSNLGPGFDQLGLALELWLEVEVAGPASGHRHEWLELGGEAASWPLEANRLLLALDAGRERLGLAATPLALRVRSEIPLRRGLGSSGAAVAAGLLLAAALAGEEAPERAALAALGTELEGHPDNVTASLLGGCTLGVPLEDGTLRVVRPPLAEGLLVGVAWPSTPLDTGTARGALPEAVPLADAVHATRRLALLLEGLRTGEPALLAAGGEDRLHTPFRLPLIAGAEEALAAARAAGAPLAAISGSGSALVALAVEEGVTAGAVGEGVTARAVGEGVTAGAIGEGVTARAVGEGVTARAASAMAEALAPHHEAVTWRVLRPAREGALLLPAGQPWPTSSSS